MSCVDKRNICLIRGDYFEHYLGLSKDWPEVIADPALYDVRMVFRDEQDDGLTPYLAIPATYELNPDTGPCNCEPPILFKFEATPAETQSLPEWDIVYYVELVKLGDTGGHRLYQGRVDVSD